MTRKGSLWVVVVVLQCLSVSVEAQDRDGVCVRDVDIKNDPKKLIELRGCEVLEGCLQVVLMDDSMEEDFDGLSFPELREVTGYVLFHKVSGLRSLGQLFPNLTVIRGAELVHKYALVVNDMPSLVDLGLGQLQVVVRGAVRVTGNPELCFADTLDWDDLAPAGVGDHEVELTDKECDTCSCPSGRCWGLDNCRAETKRGVLRGPGGVRCDRECLLGCRGPGPSDCLTCANFEHHGKCIPTCPKGTLSFMGHLCVTLDWCAYFKHSADIGGIVFRESCVKQCPAGYQYVNEEKKKTRKKSTCQPCLGPCRSECSGVIVRSLREARRLRGCTIVTGSLHIELSMSTDEERELEPLLGHIQVIRGSLVVSRSHWLTSLHFLRSLHLINGTDKSKKHALLINDNENLQQLFDWGQQQQGHRPLRINSKGDINFFYNPRLCPQEIDKFRVVTKVVEVQSASNGFSCGPSNLSSAVAVRGPESVVLSWPAWQPGADLVGYAIFVVQAAHRNVTEYATSNQCEADRDRCGWVSHDVRFSRDEVEVSQLIPRLRPATQYAYYIKTYTTTANVNSAIRYFRTKSDRPSPPLNLRAVPPSGLPGTADAGVLNLAWEPPMRPNRELSHYLVTGELREDDRWQLAARDYCALPGDDAVRGDGNDTAAAGRCDCCKELLDEDQCERLLRGSGPVLDACGNLVRSMDRCTHVLYSVLAENLKRSSSSSFPKGNLEERPVPDISEKWANERWKRRFVLVVSADTAGTVTTQAGRLVPFGLYSVHVYACGQRDEEPSPGHGRAAPLLVVNCGAPAITSGRTLPMADLDMVEAFNTSLEGRTLLLSWEEPRHPNGLVLAYHVSYEYRDADGEPDADLCVSRQSHRASNGSVRLHLREKPASSLLVKVCTLSLAQPAGPGRCVEMEVEVARSKPSPTPSQDAQPAPAPGSPPTAAAAVVGVLVVLVVALISLGLYAKRHPEGCWPRRDRDGDGQRLVNPDLTDCWDLPQEDDWGVHVRFRRDSQVTILPARSARQDEDVFVPWEPEVSPPQLDERPPPFSPEFLATLHPTNPFHPNHQSQVSDDVIQTTCPGSDREVQIHPRRHAANPFVIAWGNEPDVEHDLSLTGFWDSDGRGAASLWLDLDPQQERVAPDSDDEAAHEDRSTATSTEHIRRSCSSESFISVNLNDESIVDTNCLLPNETKQK